MILKIFIKQTGTYNAAGTQIYFDGANPYDLKLFTGVVPTHRQWPSYGNYIDVTESIGDVYKLKLTWTAERDNEGFITPGATQNKKGSSGTLSFEAEAYTLLKKWLVDDVSAPLNSVDVKIVHEGCGEYLDYVIKSTDLQWCENDICSFDISIKQKDEILNCIKSTYISDNHKKWFQRQPDNKKHPRFSYCNEQRPNGILVMLWWMTAVVTVPTLMVLIPIMSVLNSIFFAINMLIGIVNTIRKIFGGGTDDKVDWETIPYFDFKALMNAYGAYFVESAGCGREHPAPLIRDYITNVCEKCGVQVNALSAPIFFAENLTIETASKGLTTVGNPHYNACYFYPVTERGIRRFASLNALRAIPNNTDYYIPDNAPLHTLDEFLDELKGLYNAEWRVTNGVLYFQRKDWFLHGGYVYDFTDNGTDRNKILQGLCFEWNEVKYPALVEGLYADDPADTCGNEAKKHMNAYMSYGSVDENPNFEGTSDKTVMYGATKFRFDGASDDYIYDAMQVVINSSFLTPFMAGTMLDFVEPAFEEFADYALLLKDETCTLPKVLIWDGERYDNARCAKVYSTQKTDNNDSPPINQVYNKTAIPWIDRHSEHTFVRGSGLTLPRNQPGYYLLSDFTGVRKKRKPALLVNYPMYFEPYYADTMWDYFHWIDDPRLNPAMHQNWNVKIGLCCDDLKKLKVFDDARNIVLGEKVKLPSTYYTDGVITEIEVSYDPTDNLGQYIQLKGTV